MASPHFLKNTLLPLVFFPPHAIIPVSSDYCQHDREAGFCTVKSSLKLNFFTRHLNYANELASRETVARLLTTAPCFPVPSTVIFTRLQVTCRATVTFICTWRHVKAAGKKWEPGTPPLHTAYHNSSAWKLSLWWHKHPNFLFLCGNCLYVCTYHLVRKGVFLLVTNWAYEL